MSTLKSLLLSLVWTLIVFSGSGVLAVFVPPAWSWPVAILAVLLPGLCILLLVSLPLTLASKKWVPSALSIVLVVVVLSRHVSLDRWSTPDPESGDIVLMTYNAPKYPDDESARDEVSALISRIKPDVLALQESVVWSMKRSPYNLHTHRKFQPVIDSLGYVAVVPPEGGPPSRPYTHWKPPVLSKIMPDKQEQIEVAGAGKRGSNSSLLRTELTWAGRKMAVYNVHLTSHGVNKPWQRPGSRFSTDAWIRYLKEMKNGFALRERQVEQIRKLIHDETLPVVLVGDFNNTPDSWSYSQLSKGLRDAYRLSGSGWGATYHADHPAVRIDFVLLGPEFEPVSASVADPYPSSSDHRPLIARFRWRRETN